MPSPSIAFIGGGNMATSLVGGLIADGTDPASIHVADPSQERRDYLAERFGVAVSPDNAATAAAAQVLVLAVKPQVLGKVVRDLAPTLAQARPLVVSIAAGVREPSIRRWIGADLPIVRTMPNTPALVGSGATALVANPFVDQGQRDQAESVMRAVGLTVWLEDEAQMDAVTAVSGSGPAYFFLYMEALEQAGRDLGLPADTARLLTLQTAFGAAKLALESGDDAATLRRKVTSPGGTTEKALAALTDADLPALLARAAAAAAARSQELAAALDSDSGEDKP